MWKLSWFFRDFGYGAELLGKNEIDDKALVDLRGVGTSDTKRTWLTNSLIPAKKETSPDSAIACSLRKRRCARGGSSKDQSGDPCGDGGYNPVAGQLLHE